MVYGYVDVWCIKVLGNARKVVIVCLNVIELLYIGYVAGEGEVYGG